MVKGSILEKKISIKVNNQSVIQVLHEIEIKGDIVFSFKSDAFDKQRKISLDSDNKTISEILDIIFKTEPLKYKELGNQIVLYNVQENEIKKESENNKIEPEPQVKILNDTIYRYINTTTVKVYDTVRYVFFDTVRAKPQPVKHNTSVELAFTPVIYFSNYLINNPGYNNVSESLNSSKKPGFSYTITGKVCTSFNRVKLSTGISYSVLQEKFDIRFFDTTSTTSYETIRTWITELDTSYYETNGTQVGKPGGNDTIWTFIYNKIPVDNVTAIKKTDTTEIDSTGKNTVRFLSVPIIFGWEKQLTENIFFTINTGPAIDFLIAKKGAIINPLPEIQLQKFDEITFLKINLSWILNAGIYYKFNSNWSAMFQIQYNRSLQSIFTPDFPLHRYNQYFGCTVGCAYSF